MVVELVDVSVIHIGLIELNTIPMLYIRTWYSFKLYLNATSGAICFIVLGCRNTNQSEPSLIYVRDALDQRKQGYALKS